MRYHPNAPTYDDPYTAFRIGGEFCPIKMAFMEIAGKKKAERDGRKKQIIIALGDRRKQPREEKQIA